jgi:hypothetical protein
MCVEVFGKIVWPGGRGVKELLIIRLDKVFATALAILIAGSTAHARAVMQTFPMAVGAGAPYGERDPDWRRGANLFRIGIIVRIPDRRTDLIRD